MKWRGKETIAIHLPIRQVNNGFRNVARGAMVMVEVRGWCVMTAHVANVSAAVRVETNRALGIPARPSPQPLLPSPILPHPSRISSLLGSSCVAASKIAVTKNRATHGALCANVVWDVGVLA